MQKCCKKRQKVQNRNNKFPEKCKISNKINTIIIIINKKKGKKKEEKEKTKGKRKKWKSYKEKAKK